MPTGPGKARILGGTGKIPRSSRGCVGCTWRRRRPIMGGGAGWSRGENVELKDDCWERGGAQSTSFPARSTTSPEVSAAAAATGPGPKRSAQTEQGEWCLRKVYFRGMPIFIAICWRKSHHILSLCRMNFDIFKLCSFFLFLGCLVKVHLIGLGSFILFSFIYSNLSR